MRAIRAAGYLHDFSKVARLMTSDFVECPETIGKTIETLRIYRDSGDGTEIQIDFSDGTSFNCSFGVKSTVEASVLQPGAGEPKVLKSYSLD